MDDSMLQIALYLAAGIVGVVVGWLIQSARNARNTAGLQDDWQTKLSNLTKEHASLSDEASGLRSTIESQRVDIRKHEHAVEKSRTELESALEKEKLLSKTMFTLRAEREEFKGKVEQLQNALQSVQRQSTELQSEFMKSGEFYKSELTKSFEKRKTLEVNLENAMLEHESFTNLLEASQSEQESVNKMLASAQNRLANLDLLEQDVIRLQAENAQLRHDASHSKQEIEVLMRDVAELDELKVQNQELAHCLKSMESSRSQYETDAKRYRDHAKQTEQKSQTLQVRLDEVEKNFASIEKQKHKARKGARAAAASQGSNGQTPVQQEHDDLQKITGIGKVFEQTLHELGVFSYRQIANFDVADIARVNSQLKEFKGRMEQDDWIGQAKDLLFKKYG